MEYVTFLPKQTGQILLYLWRADINSTKKLLSPVVRKDNEPSDGQELACKAVATARKICSGSEGFSTTGLSLKDENIFTSTSHKTFLLIKIFVKAKDSIN